MYLKPLHVHLYDVFFKYFTWECRVIKLKKSTFVNKSMYYEKLERIHLNKYLRIIKLATE